MSGEQHRVGRGLDAEELVDKREYKLKRRLQSQTLRHMVTFLITVRSPEVVIRSAIISPSKYSRHESSIRDVEIACGARGDTFSSPIPLRLRLSLAQSSNSSLVRYTRSNRDTQYLSAI